MFNYEKYIFLMQNVTGNPMVESVFLYVVRTPRNHVWLYGVTIRRNAVEINLAFEG